MSTDESHSEFLTWTAGDARFAMPVKGCREITRTPRRTHVPGAHAALPGVTNLRGEVVTLLDLRVLLGMPDPCSGRVIVRVRKEGGGGVCILADKIHEILSLPRASVEEVPASLTGLDRRYLKGIFRHHSILYLVVDYENLRTGRTVGTQTA